MFCYLKELLFDYSFVNSLQSGKWLWGDPCSRGHVFESRRHILDGHAIFHIDLLQKLYCLFEKAKIKPKRGRGWPILKTRYN